MLSSFRPLYSRVSRRMRRRARLWRSTYRNRQTSVSSVSPLSRSCSALDTLTLLYQHRWSLRDGHYLLLASISIWALCIMENMGAMAKGLTVVLYFVLLILPITSQFFLPFSPIATWLLLLFSSRYDTMTPIKFDQYRAFAYLLIRASLYIDLYQVITAQQYG